MVIGIIGKGKMGKDLYNYLFQFEVHRLVWICRRAEDVEALTEAVEKQLSKQLRRGFLNESAYEARRSAFTVSADLGALKECDLVIESIWEDTLLKQELFQRVEAVVGPDCILATNTSSIPLRRVFAKCTRVSRCLGLHFFFPVKITKAVELNRMNCTGERYAVHAAGFLAGIAKSVLELPEAANMVLTRLINVLTAHLYNVYQESHFPVQELDRIVKAEWLTFGLFEILDATGVNICIKSMEHFNTERYQRLFQPLYRKMQLLLEKGYPGGNGQKGLLSYEMEHPVLIHPPEAAKLTEIKHEVVLDLQCLLLNELALILTRQEAAQDQIGAAVREVLGLAEDPFALVERLGAPTIAGRLEACYLRFGDSVYQPLDLTIMKRLH